MSIVVPANLGIEIHRQKTESVVSIELVFVLTTWALAEIMVPGGLFFRPLLERLM